MKTIIAEKPSVAKEIASLLDVSEKRDGYLTGNGYFVTWAFGHLIGLAMPEEYGISRFQKEILPIIPNPFLLTVRKVKMDKGYTDDNGAMKQLKVIKDLFNKKQHKDQFNNGILNILILKQTAREGKKLLCIC